ncbi:MAG TPA: ATP-binding protein [Pyrinomonadaceae bacterium]|nr:ATP-binding protein [Pyrinomonadaceae bacterium]
MGKVRTALAMSKSLKVLHIEDSESDVALLQRHLRSAGYELTFDRVDNAAAMEAALKEKTWDVILCDYSMPRFSALAALQLIKEQGCDLPFIIVSGTVGEAAAVDAMRAGAHDYLMKDKLVRLVPAIERELKEAQNRRLQRDGQDQLRLQSAALEAAANAIMITDQKGRIVWANRSFTETTGFSLAEARGKNPRFLKSGKHPREFYKEMWDTILAGKVWRNTIVNQRKDGALTREDMTITPITNGEKKITHFVAMKQDINKLEEALSEVNRKNEELAGMTQQLWQASKLATMGELSASIAHELNNPLATVGLRTEALMMQTAEDEPKYRALEIISQEVDRMAALVNNLLQFSRRSHRQISTTDVREEIVNSIEFVQYHLRSRKVEVQREFAKTLPNIHADRQQLRQLFLNLITNASDAMPDGGRLTVRAELTNVEGADAVAVEFADTGEGIPVENLEKIWDAFFTTKAEGKGTGLGLAICRRIIEEHNGTIEIRSATNVGTTVRMVFPATEDRSSNQP